jgi:hypothetical protein
LQVVEQVAVTVMNLLVVAQEVCVQVSTLLAVAGLLNLH